MRIGIWDFSSDPGLVWLRPFSCIFARSPASRRSMVAADIMTSAAAVSSPMDSSPNRRSTGTRSASTGDSRLPVGAPSTAQQNRSATTTSGPYRGSRALRGRTTLGVNTPARALRAWLRCQPVVEHNSSRIRPLPALPARLYRVAIVLVTAWRWLIVSPINRAYRLDPSQARPGGAPYARTPW